ncbi:MAG: zinc-binding dehydrogenase [Capsulimonadaceae bacterium]|nr:zinc-binding dehydrogenase [Capsulimonadaceae bacterium]
MEKRIAFVAPEQAALVDAAPPTPPGSGEVLGRTIVTLISPGTELNANYRGTTFPSYSGYASIFEVAQVGPNTTGVSPGQILYAMGGHCSFQKIAVANTLPVPDGLPPQRAVIARLMGVSMTTLVTTRARPGEIVLVAGLGPVGYLAALQFRRTGYRVVVCDPEPSRRNLAASAGFTEVFPSIPFEDPAYAGKVALVVECSGHEQAALDGCKIVRRLGEVVLVGVPWKQYTDISAHSILHAVFHKYALLRSGWEWEAPMHSSLYDPVGIMDNIATALRWLSDGSVEIGDTINLLAPPDAASVYRSLADRTLPGLFPVFEWSR